ncbi:hypothetical protein FALBO_6992 [Fusarium albosuccineum]|uniref:Uncharacterized protein n=1 Tax=Fusarium albosuccineum TaxID=1237068 RepID=A0A8H4LEP9_9HYPO|nr:hypothetical protein FALBO_6992 [Fusarium albosuccineum]
MLSKLAKLVVSATITLSLSRYASATPIISDPSLARVGETHDDIFMHPSTNFQQPLAKPESTLAANKLVLNMVFTYSFDKISKDNPLKNLPVWLTYYHPLRGNSRIKTVTDDNGKAKFEASPWPEAGIKYDITVILDGRPAGSPYIIVDKDPKSGKPIQYVTNYEKHHEYYGGGDGGGHAPCAATAQTEKVAFGEGFASAYALIMEEVKDGILKDGSSNPPNYELYSCGSSQDMNTDEGRFTAALYDLWDTADDSNQGDPKLGANGHKDGNKDLVLTPKQILLDPIKNALTKGTDKYILSPRAYWKNFEEAFIKNKGSDPKWEDRLEKAREVFRYNYANFI